jgi:hypothetical protein
VGEFDKKKQEFITTKINFLQMIITIAKIKIYSIGLTLNDKKDAEETYIRMDKKNKNVGLKAGSNIGLTAKKDVGINAEGNVNISSKASVAINAEGTANFTAKSAITVDGGSALTLKGGNVTLNGENGVTIEGQRTSINTPKIYLGQGGTPAVIQTTQFVGYFLGAPIVSTATGPFSSTVFIAP